MKEYKWYTFAIGLFLMVVGFFVVNHLVGGLMFLAGSLLWFFGMGLGSRLWKR